ncbi:EamA family transporter [Dyella sp. Tek66A03]|uniref:EamA family transporter n=1 Tax=Dyella sp. Tek66A03 TaxID=3458298 RepID=UPI00403E830F
MGYISWALIGMTGYSAVTLFAKLATRSGNFPNYLVLAIATVIVAVAAVSISLLHGDFRNLAASDFLSLSALWSYAAGVALTIAVASLFRALSLGPASSVVPIYGMFIVGGSMLGVMFLPEPLLPRKVLGVGMAVASIFSMTK